MQIPWGTGEQDWRVKQGIDPALKPQEKGKIPIRQHQDLPLVN